MTLIEAMQSNELVYVAYAPRWLAYENGKFVVYEHLRYGDGKVRIVCETDSEAIAVAALLNEEANE